jgi:cytoskeleton protein RodZ
MSDMAADQAVGPEVGDRDDLNRKASSPGAQLAAERQARGWTIEEVATQLNLAPRQIQAIEADNFAALPGMASVRGFIRGYAKILKIDPSPLVAMVAGEAVSVLEPVPMRRALSEPFSDNRLGSSGNNGMRLISVILAFFVVVALAGVLVTQQMGWSSKLQDSLGSKISEMSSAPIPAQSASVPAAREKSNPASANAATQDIPSIASIAASDLVTAQVSGTPLATGIGSSAPAANTKATEPTLVPPPVTHDKSVTPGDRAAELVSAGTVRQQAILPARVGPVADGAVVPSRNSLVLKPREDSWIQVVRTNGTTVISRLLKAGATETVEVAEPLTLTIGNASGVEVILRGKVVDLRSSTKNNVVRLSLK